MSACACENETPDFSLPSTKPEGVFLSLRSLVQFGKFDSGIHSSTFLSGNWNVDGITPKTAILFPSTSRLLPSTVGESPNHRLHRPRLTTTTRLPRFSSSAENVRPLIGATPIRENRFADVLPATTRS